MILQELIRNVILYREVLKPVLFSWKESFAAGNHKEVMVSPSSMILSALNKAKALGDGEELGWDTSDEYELYSLRRASGSRTITTQLYLPIQDGKPVCQAEKYSVQASFSKEILIVLAGERFNEKVVDIGKTYSEYSALFIDYINPRTGETISATTGFESKQIKSFLISETHERREYLGEFSLTHEETPLLYLSERGWNHDTY